MSHSINEAMHSRSSLCPILLELSRTIKGTSPWPPIFFPCAWAFKATGNRPLLTHRLLSSLGLRIASWLSDVVTHLSLPRAILSKSFLFCVCLFGCITCHVLLHPHLKERQLRISAELDFAINHTAWTILFRCAGMECRFYAGRHTA